MLSNELIAIYAIYLLIAGKPLLGIRRIGMYTFHPTIWLRLAGGAFLLAYILLLITGNFYSAFIFIIEVVAGIFYIIGLFFAFASPRHLA